MWLQLTVVGATKNSQLTVKTYGIKSTVIRQFLKTYIIKSTVTRQFLKTYGIKSTVTDSV